MKKESKFDEFLLKTVNEELKRIFGEVATLVIYGYLETQHSLKHEDIPRNIEVFAKGFNKFLNSGALVVERIILENLYSSFGLKFRVKKGYGFIDYVNELKNSLSRHEAVLGKT